MPRRFIYTVVFTLLTVTAFGATPGMANGKRPVPMDLYRFVLEAQGKVQIADKKMIDCMNQLSDMLSAYSRKYGRLPQSVSDLERFAAPTSLSNTKNPYLEHDYMSRELPADTPPNIKVELVEDYGISCNGISELAQHPPKTWEGNPGTIIIAHNSESQFCIRACGLTRRPIEDATTHSAYVLYKNLAGY